jgi:acyl-coenzyme A thioesterase PaaI-like protein
MTKNAMGCCRALGITLPAALCRHRVTRKAILVAEKRIPLPRLEASDCFGCGTRNPIGLRMIFYRQGNAICSDVMLTRDHVGWQNMAHGGIISTLLDEVMAWAVIYLRKAVPVTRKMTVRYRAPVPVEIPLTVRGTIAPEGKSRTCRTSGVLLDGQAKTLATSEAEFVLFSAEMLTALPEDMQQEMSRLFERLGSEPA